MTHSTVAGTLARVLLDAVGCVARTAPRIVTAATASLGVAAAIFTTACYTYEVKAPTDLLAGQHVEVTVNNIGRVALTADLGDDVTVVGGDVVAVTDSSLRVAVNTVDFLNGTSTGYPGGSVNIPRNAITSVSTKQFSQSKTAIAAVGIVAALIAVIGAIRAVGGGNSTPDSKGGGGNGQAIQ